jgi:hypothetical protein
VVVVVVVFEGITDVVAVVVKDSIDLVAMV